MNLISIEEHLACSYARTDDQAFLELLPEIRDMRRTLMKQLVREGNGEGWCISKHLLASSMRLLEVANKRQADGKEAESRDLIDKAFTLGPSSDLHGDARRGGRNWSGKTNCSGGDDDTPDILSEKAEASFQGHRQNRLHTASAGSIRRDGVEMPPERPHGHSPARESLHRLLPRR
jgi:hypothetical protein